jgi:uracil permease
LSPSRPEKEIDLTEQEKPPIALLDQWPRPGQGLILSLQWLVVIMPGILVLGKVIASAQGLDSLESVSFLQRLLLLMGLVQAAQISKGHGLPGVVGPSAVLLIGILSTLSSGLEAVYGAMTMAAFLTFLVGLTGLAARLGKLFTRPILASTLVLIAVTLSPAMRDQLFSQASKGGPMISFAFGFLLCCAMLWAQYRLKGLLSSASLLLGVILGSVLFHLAGLWSGPLPSVMATPLAGLPSLPDHGLIFDPSVIVSFCLCYLALISTGEVCQADNMPGRLNRTLITGGLGGVLAGVLGVPGPVTYSVSPAVVMASRAKSQWPLLPVAIALCLMAFFPVGLSLFALTPEPVVGAVMLYLMAGTVYAAIDILTGSNGSPKWREGVIVGVAMVVGLMVAYLPTPVKESMPATLRPILANGFVVGLISALLLEHLVFRDKK